MLIRFSIGFVQVSHLFFVEICLNMAVLENTVLGVSAALLRSVTAYVLPVGDRSALWTLDARSVWINLLILWLIIVNLGYGCGESPSIGHIVVSWTFRPALLLGLLVPGL